MGSTKNVTSLSQFFQNDYIFNGEVTAKNVEDYFNNASNVEEINNLITLGVKVKESDEVVNENGIAATGVAGDSHS